jgi:hypothetical protein
MLGVLVYYLNSTQTYQYSLIRQIILKDFVAAHPLSSYAIGNQYNGLKLDTPALKLS